MMIVWKRSRFMYFSFFWGFNLAHLAQLRTSGFPITSSKTSGRRKCWSMSRSLRVGRHLTVTSSAWSCKRWKKTTSKSCSTPVLFFWTCAAVGHPTTVQCFVASAFISWNMWNRWFEIQEVFILMFWKSQKIKRPLCYFLLGSFETSLWSKSNSSSQIFLAADAGASENGRGAAGKVSDGRSWSRQGSTVAMRLLSSSTVDLSMKPFGNDRFGAATIGMTLVADGFFLYADLDTKFAKEVRQVKMIGFNYDMWWLNPSCTTLSINTLRAMSRLQKNLRLRARNRIPSAAKCKGPLSVCLEKLTFGYLVDEAQPLFWKSVGPGFLRPKVCRKGRRWWSFCDREKNHRAVMVSRQQQMTGVWVKYLSRVLFLIASSHWDLRCPKPWAAGSFSDARTPCLSVAARLWKVLCSGLWKVSFLQFPKSLN